MTNTCDEWSLERPKKIRQSCIWSGFYYKRLFEDRYSAVGVSDSISYFPCVSIRCFHGFEMYTETLPWGKAENHPFASLKPLKRPSETKRTKQAHRQSPQRGLCLDSVWVQRDIFVLLNYENNLLELWDISLEESVPKALSLADVFVGVGVGLESSSWSALVLELFTLLLFSRSTSSSSSIVHCRARLNQDNQRIWKNKQTKQQRRGSVRIRVVDICKTACCTWELDGGSSTLFVFGLYFKRKD